MSMQDTQDKVRNHDWTVVHEGKSYSLPGAITKLDDLEREVRSLEDDTQFNRDLLFVSILCVIASGVLFFTTESIKDWLTCVFVVALIGGGFMLFLGGIISGMLFQVDTFKFLRSKQIDSTRSSAKSLRMMLMNDVEQYLASVYDATASVETIENIVEDRPWGTLRINTPEGIRFVHARHSGRDLLLVESVKTHTVTREI